LARLGQRELATRIAKGVLFRFEPLLHAARWRGGEEPPTPPWVSAARNLLHELDGPSPGEQRL
jgi:hypothetical protein